MATSVECTAIRGFNNTGKIKKLDDRYYEVVLGVLEYPNSIGALYDTMSAEKILESTPFKRKILEGNLKGEWGHPKEEDSKNEIEYLRRIHQIYEDKIAIHIRRVHIVKDYVLPDGSKVTAFIGEVCGSGIHADKFDRMMENPHENVCFSVRSMATDRVVGGKLKKFFDTIITWDLVTEPGLKPSTKFNSPSCEHFIEVQYARRVTLPILEKAMETKKGKMASNESGYHELNHARRVLQEKTKLLSGASSFSDWR